MLAALNRRGGRRRATVESDRPIDVLCQQLKYSGVPAPVAEFRLDPSRRFRFDLAWPDWKIAIEIEGLVYSNRGDNQLVGRHVSVTGFKRDIEKYRLAFERLWFLLRVTSADARSGVACNAIVEHLRARGLV